MLRIHRVQGQSMAPAYNDGDYVVSLGFLPVREGDVVVVQHPLFGRIIKRVAELDDHSGIRLQGDNPQSTSSEAMGWLTRQQLLGRVCWHIRKPVTG